MFFKNQRGVSLVEGVIGGAITIGAALTVMKMNGTTVKTNKTLERNNEMISQISEIRSILSNPTACKHSFETFNAKDTTGITTIKDLNDNETFAVGKQYGSSRIIMSSIRMSDSLDSVAVVPGSIGNTNLFITFDRGKNALGSRFIEKTVRLNVTTDADSKVISCFANSSGNAGSLWRPSLSDPNKIYYQTGNVGIGTDDPTGALDITNAIGQKDIRIHKFGTGPRNAAAIAGRRARGTPGSPSTVLDGDTLLTFVAKGHNGVDYSGLAGGMNFAVDGTVTTSSMPTKFTISTTKPGDTAPTSSFVIRSSGNVGIGTDDPTGALDITNTIGQKDIRIHKFGTGPRNAAAIAGRRARGNPGAPAAVLDGDGLLTFVAKGHTGTDFLTFPAGVMGFSVDGPVSATSVPSRFAIGTTAPGATAVTERLVVRSNGNVGIGTSDPTAALDITNTVGQKDIRIHKFGTGPRNAAAIAGRRARGTPGSPSTVLDGDSLLTFVAKGHNGVDYSGLAGGMNFAVDGTVTTSSMPTKFTISTTKPGDTAPTSSFVIRSNGNVGIGTEDPTHDFHLVGSAAKTTGTSWTNISDGRLKQIEGKYNYGLFEVLELNPVRFRYIKNEKLGLSSQNEQVGFVAQEVERVIPEAVNLRDDGYLELNVDPIHWAMVNAIKELNQKKEEILIQNAKLKAQNKFILEQNKLIKSVLCELKPQANLCKTN